MSESTLVKMPHCWKSHVAAHFICVVMCECLCSDVSSSRCHGLVCSCGISSLRLAVILRHVLKSIKHSLFFKIISVLWESDPVSLNFGTSFDRM